MNLSQAVSAAFAYLEPRVANYPRNETAAMAAWVTDLTKADVKPDELERFVEKWARSEKFMPVPADILGPIYAARQKSDAGLVIHDPVKTGEHMRVDEIGSREACEAKGLPFVELREPSPPELPSPELREQALTRLESLERRAIKPVPRPARERAMFDSTPDPAALALTASNVERARREG